MGPWSARQLAALGAVVAAVLVVVGFLIPGSPPKFDANALQIISYFQSKHQKVLVSTVLIEIGAAVLVFVLAQLVMMLRDAGHHAHAAVIGIGGAASVGSLAVGTALMGGLAQLVGFGTVDAAAVSPLYRLVQFVYLAWSWMAFVMVLAVAVAAWQGAFPQWVAAANGIVAILMLLSSVSVKAHGAFAAGTGTFAGIAGFAFLVWVLHLAVLFWRPQGSPAAAAATA